MNEKTILIPTTNGKKEEIKLPNYGEIILTVRNGKIANIRIVNDKKYVKRLNSKAKDVLLVISDW